MNMNRGEIWLVQLNPSVGSEIGKTRPVITQRISKYAKRSPHLS